MKTVFLILYLTFGSIFAAYAQKFGYIDSEFILRKMPEYKEAQKEISKLSASWRDEIKNMRKDIEAAYSEYKAEEPLLTEDMKRERIAAIRAKEKEVEDYNQKVFGYDGLFFLKKQELLKPVQDEVFDAVEKMSKEQRLAIVFDKSGDMVMIYTDPVHDYTEFVLEILELVEKQDELK
ncbi:MAG: OmpH family outer membrane protein [Cyclobacteriaceae bacterium]|nr:OmpH family outer membrane protein [Cyclobacteriaceae bacterium]MCH8515645.1 OmpH family outer membrane protein [Cyclobacteriaceae bacterium]